MRRETYAEQVEQDARFGVQMFEEAYADYLAQILEGGRVPGQRVPSKRELRRFFETTNAEYWATVASADPREAMRQLDQWRGLVPEEERDQMAGSV